jgi:hypothetical protein
MFLKEVLGSNQQKQQSVFVARPTAVRPQQTVATITLNAPVTSSFSSAVAVGYPQDQQFLLAADAPTASYAAAIATTPQHLSYPNFGSVLTIATTKDATGKSHSVAPTLYGQFIKAGNAPDTVTPTLYSVISAEFEK